jgi:uncharacterized protein
MVLNFIYNFLKETWMLAAQMSPYLILGFVIGGILHVFLPASMISRFMGKESIGSVIKATLIGVPLPLCSCGVLPVAASARKSGAGKAPTLSFIITTPVTGVDSILATIALMGAMFTGFRIAASLTLGIMAGVLAIVIPDKSSPPEPDSCNSCERTREATSIVEKAKQAVRYSFVELPESLAGSVLLGLLIGGAISAMVPADFVGEYIGGGVPGILVAVAIGIPLYVCATGSIPIAAAMMMKGFSPGAALAFLIAGPATNAVAFTTVKKILGARSLVIYLVSIFVGAVGFGLILDYAVPGSITMNMSHLQHVHQAATLPWYYTVSGVFLLSLLGYFKASQWLSRLREKGGKSMKEDENSMVLSVPNMSCDHCKESIIKNLTKLESVKAVAVDLKKKIVTVSTNKQTDPGELIKSLATIGFDATLMEKSCAVK